MFNQDPLVRSMITSKSNCRRNLLSCNQFPSSWNLDFSSCWCLKTSIVLFQSDGFICMSRDFISRNDNFPCFFINKRDICFLFLRSIDDNFVPTIFRLTSQIKGNPLARNCLCIRCISCKGVLISS